MNMSWVTMIGGGVTAAVTLGIGISTSGILTSDALSKDSTPVAGETIYVEQPVIEVEASPLEIAGAFPNPIVIAILPDPAPSESATDEPLTSDPSIPMPSYVDSEDDEYEDSEDHEDNDGDEGEDHHGDDDSDEGFEDGDDD